MKFNYIVKHTLPPLSWLAIVSNGREVIDVYTGNAVETFDDFFVSGAWDGDFEIGDFDKCNFACCTGARLQDSRISFLTPHHLNACIFSIKMSDNILVLSNSVSFLLAITGDRFDPDYYEYDSDFCIEFLGKRNMKPPFFSNTKLLNKSILNIYSYAKVSVDINLSVTIERRHTSFRFNNFTDYRQALSDTLHKLKNNVDSRLRKCNYGMIATISKGYDAPTCATLSREIGCEEVFTFNRPDHYKNDCGTEIAKKMGFKVIHECDGDFVKSNEEYIEAADFASGDSGGMLTFEGHKDLFKNKLLFCGFQGDEFWGIDHLPYENLQYPIVISNSNSYEVFLETNTILIMIPSIGAEHAKQLYNISLSDEMKPWRMGVKYDRPICRRIVEEAGISRDMFGQLKVGSGYCLHFDTFKSMKKKLSPLSYLSLREYSRKLKQNPLRKIRAYSLFFLYNIPVYLPYLLSKFHISFSMKPWVNHHLSNPLSTTYIMWGVDHMTKRYKDAFSEDKSFEQINDK